jgi:hypothetical protein
MTTVTAIEERLEKVEIAVRELQRTLAIRPVDPNWLERMTGCIGGDPGFEEVVRLGREIRQADRPAEDDES